MRKDFSSLSIPEGAMQSLIQEFVNAIRDTHVDDLEKSFLQLYNSLPYNDIQMKNAVMVFMLSFIQAKKYKMCI